MKKLSFLSILPIVFVFALTVSAGPGGKAAQWKPEYENFWRDPPKKDSFTVMIWSFDKGGDVRIDDIDDLDNLDAEPAGSSALTSIQQKIAFQLNGDAKNVRGGKFGSCIAVKGKGWISSNDLDFISTFHADNVAAIDFWLKLDNLDGNEGKTIISIGKKQPYLSLQLEKEGKLALLSAGQPVMTNSRKLKAGTWTHICVGLIKHKRERTVSPLLLVNGLPGNHMANQKFEEMIDRWLRFNKGRVTIGADASGKNGINGAIDSVRVMKKEPKFYVLEDWSFMDVAKKRTPKTGQPYFVRNLEPVVSCSFDKTLKPETFKGFGTKQQARDNVFKPGVRGQAFDLSTLGKDAQFELQGLSVIPQKKGAIEFWIRPTGWDNAFVGDFLGTNIPKKILFKQETDNTPVYLNGYKSLRFLMGRNAQQSKSRYVHIDPGSWTHVLVTWDGKQRAAYLNGLPQPIHQFHLAGMVHPTDKKHYEAWLKKSGGKDDGTYKLRFKKSKTLVDEFRIYDRAFLPTEAWNAYARFFPEGSPGKAMKELPWICLDFDYIAHSWDMVQKLLVNAACLPIKGVSPATMDLVIKDKDGKTMVSESDVKLDDDGKATLKLLKEFPFGTYPVSVTVKDKDGKVMKSLDTTFTRVKPVWYQNQLGKEHIVPPPWQPITIENNKVSVTGREIVLNPGGLPQQITTNGLPVLKEPVTVTAVIDGKESRFKPAGPLTFTEKGKDIVKWQGILKNEKAFIEVNTSMEYDGLMSYALTIKPTTDTVTISKLTVDVPMDATVTSQLICNTGASNFRAAYDIRMIPQGEGSVWNSMNSKPKMHRGVTIGNFCANLWIGGDDVGLNFSAENDKGWMPDDKTAAHEILRQGKEAVTYRMNVISKPVKISKSGRTFTFILTPTPTKPEPKGWRAWGRLPKGKPHNANDVVDGFNGFPLTADPDESAPALSFMLEPHSWESAKAQRDKLQDKFGAENPVYFYIDYSWPKLGPSIKEWNHDLHAGTGRMAWTPEVEDYMVWIINEYIKRDIIDGIYIDDTSMGRTYSLASTGYEFPESKNKRRIGYSSMGFRRFCQRVYKLFQQHGKYPYILPHMSFCYDVPAFSFATSTVDAEGRDTGLRPGVKFDCMDLWKLDEVRIMGNGKKWGFARNWKPTLNYGLQNLGKLNKTQANWKHLQSRTMHALIIPHDFWYMWIYPTGVNIHQVFVKFGMDDPNLQYIPYWKLNGQYKVNAEEPDKIISCIFRKPKKALVMISNLSRKEQKVSVTFDPQKLFGKPGKITIEDADINLLIPYPDEVLSEKEKKVELKKGGIEDEINEDALLAELTETKSKAEKSKDKLAMKIKGDTAEMIIRRRDFRIMEVDLK